MSIRPSRNPDEISIDVGDDGAVTIVDARPRRWRVVTLGVLAAIAVFPAAAAVAMMVASPRSRGPGGWSCLLFAGIVAGVFVLSFVDDVVKWVWPAVITVDKERMRVVQPGWLGRVVRDVPVERIRAIETAVNSPTVHAWNALVVRLEGGGRFSILQCPNGARAEAIAEVLRRATGVAVRVGRGFEVVGRA